MNDDDILKYFDPTDSNAASDAGNCLLRLLRVVCEAIENDEIRLPKDGSRTELERSIRESAKALRLDYHEDELLTVDERMSDPMLRKLLGKLFCNGRELPPAKRWDGSHP